MQPHDARHAERARDEHRVARRAAVVQHDGAHAAPAEEHDVGGGERLGDDDAVLLDLRDRLALLEVAEQPVLEVEQVGAALAEVGAAGGGEVLAVLAEHGLDGAPGRDAGLLDAVAHAVVEARIVQHERLRLEERRAVGAELFLGDGRDFAELFLGPRHGLLEAADFALGLARVQQVLVGGVGAGGVDVGPPERHARRRADAAEHAPAGNRRAESPRPARQSSSPNPLSNTAAIASAAVSASAPSKMSWSVAPCSAASVITPMMLLPLIS